MQNRFSRAICLVTNMRHIPQSKLSIIAAQEGKTERQYLEAAIKRGLTGRQIAKITGISTCAISRRINMLGMRQIAEYEQLEMDRVMAVEPLGLSINRSAYMLGCTCASLSGFITRHKINWRGKGRFNGDK